MYQELKLREFKCRIDRLKYARKQELVLTTKVVKDIHIVYVMSHVGICGGVKVIFEHANRLSKLASKVSIVSHFPKPDWYPIQAEYLQIPFDIELAKGIPFCDVIVATYWDHIQSCIETGIAPVVYFEQGDYHLFDCDSMASELRGFVQTQIKLPENIFTVSKAASDSLNKYYEREAAVFHNAIDDGCFKPAKERYVHSKPYILMMGEEGSSFKGLEDVLKAFELLKKDGFDLDLLWITPYQPSEEFSRNVSAYFVNPTQDEIANLYRGAEVFVSASYYESFSLPPLEAMACGCPVVTTGNQGVLEYAKDLENALVCKISDPYDIAEKIKNALSNSELRNRLIEKGIETVKAFKWDKIIQNLFDYYKNIASYHPKSEYQLNEWETTVSSDDFIDVDDYKKFLSFLKVTNADIVKVPVIYELGDLPRLARWEVVANRRNSLMSAQELCYTCIKPNNLFSLLNIDAYLYYFKKEYEKALSEFTNLYLQDKSALKRNIYFKWIILSLQRLQRRYEAKDKVSKILKEEPFNSEAYYLQYALAQSDNENSSYSRNLVEILGDCAANSEHLFNIKAGI